MKIAVYTIALNEAQHVERFLETTASADLVVVSDTGSTDDTVSMLRAGGATVHEISVRPWRFDLARNASLAVVPADVDVCVSIDLDEVLSQGWRNRLVDEWGDGTRGRYRYVWSHNADGSDGLVQWSDKIHSRHGYRWIHPCHEVLDNDRIDERYSHLSLEVHHWPDDDKSRSDYLDLLVVGRDEMPHDPRSAYYLGREYTFRRRWAEAEAELRRYLTLPTAVWAHERAMAMRLLGDSCNAQGRPDEAVYWWRHATAEAPDEREPWVALARGLYEREDWPGCYGAARTALAITDCPYKTSWAWRERPHDLAGIAAWHLGLLDESLAQAELALQYEPADERLRGNVDLLRQRVAEREERRRAGQES